ncbi:MAG: hypothetical protein RLY93_06380 [Sumerlaeia bacterium]
MSPTPPTENCPPERHRFPSMWDVTAYRKHLNSLVCGFCGRPAQVPNRGRAQLQFCECSAGQRGSGLWLDRARWREKHGDRVLEEAPPRKPRAKRSAQEKAR